jgi:hypothetical protein
MVVDRTAADAMRLKDRSQQLADAHTRARRGTRIHMTQVEQSIATVDDGDMELLLCRPAKDRLGNCGEVCWSLHASAPCWPPRRKIACCVDGVGDELSRVTRHTSALQLAACVPLD